jgi:hypothetical protein
MMPSFNLVKIPQCRAVTSNRDTLAAHTLPVGED